MNKIFTILFCFFSLLSKAQVSASDSLKGPLNEYRNSYDVVFFDIRLDINPEKRFIRGSNTILLKFNRNAEKIQLDLSRRLQIEYVLCRGKKLKFFRKEDSFFIETNGIARKDDTCSVQISYSGYPQEAKNAPWDGGFVWKKDSEGRFWTGMACEGDGASVWLPCKDHLSDEPDSVRITLIVPAGLTAVSNGRLLSNRPAENQKTAFTWIVRNPINLYNISINIADYKHLTDTFTAEDGKKLSLDYYVLSGNESKADTHFEQVHTMLKAFEHYFGPYPFYTDGYKLVETPYWGMEHQSCIAYGNNYKNNEWGFDYIIVHESGHEWFGNSISCTDHADMWIHESFTTYSESLFLEFTKGKEIADRYILGQKKYVQNEQPMIGTYDINDHTRADNDIYYKGSWILHTLRNLVRNDSLWFTAIRGFCAAYYHKSCRTVDVIDYFSKALITNTGPYFRAYLYHAGLPSVEYYWTTEGDTDILHYKLNSPEPELVLPVNLYKPDQTAIYVKAGSAEKTMKFPKGYASDLSLSSKSVLLDIKNKSPEGNITK